MYIASFLAEDWSWWPKWIFPVLCFYGRTFQWDCTLAYILFLHPMWQSNKHYSLCYLWEDLRFPSFSPVPVQGSVSKLTGICRFECQTTLYLPFNLDNIFKEIVSYNTMLIRRLCGFLIHFFFFEIFPLHSCTTVLLVKMFWVTFFAHQGDCRLCPGNISSTVFVFI